MTEFKIGQGVRVKQGEGAPAWASDWKNGSYIIVGIVLEYQGGGELNFSLASRDEIDHKLGSTDGFKEAHLEAA